MFYLAQTYECLGLRDKAWETYEKRIAAGGWREEVYESKYRLARLAIADGKSDEEIEKLYLQAYQYAPHRAEPLYELGHRYWKQGNNAMAFLYAYAAAGMSLPKTDNLFIDYDVYVFKRFELLGIVAFYVGRHEIGKWAAQKALDARPEQEHLKKNLEFYDGSPAALSRKKSPWLLLRIAAPSMLSSRPSLRPKEIHRPFLRFGL